MNKMIETIRALANRFGKIRESAQQLEKCEAALRVGAQGVLDELADVPPEAIALPQTGQRFDAATAQRLRALSDVRTKLELAPGVMTKQREQLEALRRQIRTEVRALVRHCRDQAEQQMVDLQREVTAEVLKHCGGDNDRAKEAAVGVVEKSEANRWREEFHYYSHSDDPESDARGAIDLAEAFARGEACQ